MAGLFSATVSFERSMKLRVGGGLLGGVTDTSEDDSGDGEGSVGVETGRFPAALDCDDDVGEAAQMPCDGLSSAGALLRWSLAEPGYVGDQWLCGAPPSLCSRIDLTKEAVGGGLDGSRTAGTGTLCEPNAASSTSCDAVATDE